MNNLNLHELIKSIEPKLIEAGDYLVSFQDKTKITKSKKDQLDIQTTADLQVESILKNFIKNKYPAHSIVSEENSETKKSDFAWFIDPLDGTKEYIRGLSFYNISIFLQHNNETIFSVVYRPNDRSFYYSYDNKSYLNKEIIYPSTVNLLSESIIYVYFPNLSIAENKQAFHKTYKTIEALAEKVYRIRGSADENSAMCWVASGKCEAFIDLHNPNSHWWDIGNGIHIAKNSGCKVTDKSGHEVTSGNFKKGFLVSNSLIHEEIIKIINNRF